MRRSYWWPVLATALLALVGCARKEAPVAPRPPEVQVSEPVEKDITDFEEFTGHTDAQYSANITARATGDLTAVLFKEGDIVRGGPWYNPAKGDLLAVVDQRTYKAAVDNKRALLNSARANLEYARSSEDVAIKNLAVVEALGVAMTKEERDQKRGAVDQARANVDLMLANVRSTEADVDTAVLNFRYTEVRAPFTGRIGRRFLEVGNNVKENQTVVANIVSVNPIYVYFDMDERTLQQLDAADRDRRRAFLRHLFLLRPDARAQLAYPDMLQGHFPDWKQGTDIRMGLSAEDGTTIEERYPHTGKLDFIDNRGDQQSGTISGRGTFENANGTIPPGLFARVWVPRGKPHRALLVTESALGTDQGRKFLYVVGPDNKVAYRKVEVGQQDGSLRVIESGLNPGERVIVNGLQRAKDGIKVDPTLTDMPNAGSGRPALVSNQATGGR